SSTVFAGCDTILDNALRVLANEDTDPPSWHATGGMGVRPAPGTGFRSSSQRTIPGACRFVRSPSYPRGEKRAAARAWGVASRAGATARVSDAVCGRRRNAGLRMVRTHGPVP